MTASCRDEEIFAGAVALPAAERTQYLRRACSTDLSAFDRLRTLIGAFDDAAMFIADGCTLGLGSAGELDSYRLLRELGEGGCGVAYLAEQLKPVRRHVAVKIIKPGMDTRAVIARFEAERQLLALMDHPHVAKVFDAGSTSTGRPYFVMELVRGIRITDYCNQTRCTIAERLALFIQVCQAIQHAHQKGIIHRDIKPSNVLVTMHDGVPLAKVIDFGIAKATQGRLVDQTLHTAFDQFVGTPEYVSPEQTEPSSAAVDTRSDIYSLGVLLYELLTGCTPFETDELLRGGIEHMRQHIRTQEPARPSRRLLAAGSESVRDMSACTGTTAAKMLAEVRGDLDWIVMRCLEKDPARRYQTVNDVISELQRYLHHEPVQARPPQLTYLVAKFARRNRAMCIAVLAAIVVVIAFVTNMSIQTRRIAAERDRAEQEGARAETVSDFMLQIFDASQPQTSLGRTISAREVLDAAGRRIRGDLHQQPEVRARLLEGIGRAYRRLHLFDTAVPYFEDALRLREQLPDPDGTKTSTILLDLAMAARSQSDLPRADNLLAQALEIIRQHRSERSDIHAKLLLNLGRVQLAMGNPTQARDSLERSRELSRSLSGPLDLDVADAAKELASVFIWQENLPAAEQSAREALEIFTATLPPMHPDRVATEARLGDVLQQQGRIPEAVALLESSLAMQTQLFGANSRQVADVLDSMAAVKKAQRELPEAEDYARQALRAHLAATGSEHQVIGYHRTVLAGILVQRGKYEEAVQESRDALTILVKKLPPDHQYVASAEHMLGEALLETRELVDAESTLTTAIDRLKRNDVPAWRVARSESALGEVFYRLGRIADAELYLKRSYTILAADEHADPDARVKAQRRLSQFYIDRGQREKLDELVLATRSGPAAASDRIN